tara:strand:+ start:15484 stop:17232 length:1749 start_codon:yes stop_codon:yes gene_type:complete
MENSHLYHIPSSFTDETATGIGPKGQLAHKDLISHTKRLEQKLWEVSDGVWTLVGNGLSNQTFVRGPKGIIAIDTGECCEEMTAALELLYEETSEQIVAIIYTHFHYVDGTKAIFERQRNSHIPIWGHEKILQNRRNYGMEISTAAGRGLMHQFGIALPENGPDSVVNAGLGLAFRNPQHAPFTPGFVEPTDTFSQRTEMELAGLHIELTPSPSDADDSVTIWIPELDLCINNLVWPALFNIFAIRGEEFRDPRVLLEGLDHILELEPTFLVGTHGPPLIGKETIHEEVTKYRDSIQFLWDQSVRGINQGLTSVELSNFVQLPRHFENSYLTSQLYGVAEHHVRQIYSGLRGWFDGNEANLFPVEPIRRVKKLIEGFGGVECVRDHARNAIESNDLRWAIELCSWLVISNQNFQHEKSSVPTDDQLLLAECLRKIAQRTTSANVRNWCLTRALEREGAIDISRHRVHRFSEHVVLNNAPSSSVHALKVLLVPELAENQNIKMSWEFVNGESVGLHVRNQVAVPTVGENSEINISLTHEIWAKILAGKINVSEALESGLLSSNSETSKVLAFFGMFDHQSLNQ